MPTQSIWEVFDNLVPNSESHHVGRPEAMEAMLNALNAVWIANPGSYWRVDAYQAQGVVTHSIRTGPGGGSAKIADLTLQPRALVL